MKPTDSQSAGRRGTGKAQGPQAPSAWVARFAALVAPGAPVLDLACGGGRHTRLFLERGHPVLAVDRDLSRLAAPEGDPHLEVLACDLETGQGEAGSLPAFFQRRFGAIVVTNYLHRPLFGPIAEALAPGGVLIYETFAQGNERFGKPSNPHFLLYDGELLEAFQDRLTIVAYENVIVEKPAPAAVQRLCAQAQEASTEASSKRPEKA